MNRIAFLLFFISALSIGEETMEDLKEVLKNDQWAAAEGTHNELPLLIRFRNKLEQGTHNLDHSQLMQIYWDYTEHPSGMPSQSDSEQMEIFENRLVEALESDLSGVLVSVVTTNGYREWIYYVSSVEIFSNKLHHMPQERDPYPIEIETRSDPDWSYFYSSVRPTE